jgi:hypothetical protein
LGLTSRRDAFDFLAKARLDPFSVWNGLATKLECVPRAGGLLFRRTLCNSASWRQGDCPNKRKELKRFHNVAPGEWIECFI